MKKLLIVLVGLSIVVVSMVSFVSAVLLDDTDYYDYPQAANSRSGKRSNYLTATVDGKRMDFEIDSVKVDSRKINVYANSYNPRGEREMHLFFRFNKNLDEGVYFPEEQDAGVSIQSGSLIAKGGRVDYILDNYIQTIYPVGTFIFEISHRSEDWNEYEGKFSAELKYDSNGDGYNPQKSGQKIKIEDAVFSFSLR